MKLKIGKIYKIYLNKNYERSNIDDVYLHFASKLTKTKEGQLYSSKFDVQVLKNVSSCANLIFIGYEGEKINFLDLFLMEKLSTIIVKNFFKYSKFQNYKFIQYEI